MKARAGDSASADRDLTTTFHGIEIDWPRSAGYFGGVALAVAFEVVPLGFGLFIAALPVLKLLNRPENRSRLRFLVQVVEGAGKPVGGDSEGTVRWADGRGDDANDQPAPGTPATRRPALPRSGGGR